MTHKYWVIVIVWDSVGKLFEKIGNLLYSVLQNFMSSFGYAFKVLTSSNEAAGRHVAEMDKERQLLKQLADLRLKDKPKGRQLAKNDGQESSSSGSSAPDDRNINEWSHSDRGTFGLVNAGNTVYDLNRVALF